MKNWHKKNENEYLQDGKKSELSIIDSLNNRIRDLEKNQHNTYLEILIFMPGLTLAMLLSYTANHSIIWAVLHGFLSWLYVIFRAFS